MISLSSIITQFKKEFSNIQTDESKVREFAYVVGGVLVALGLFAAYRGRVPLSEWVGGAGSLLVVIGVIRPMVLLPLYYVWMGLAVVLGVVVGNALLTLFYFLMATPIGFLRRLFRGAPTDTGKSYWIPVPSGFKKESLEQPF